MQKRSECNVFSLLFKTPLSLTRCIYTRHTRFSYFPTSRSLWLHETVCDNKLLLWIRKAKDEIGQMFLETRYNSLSPTCTYFYRWFNATASSFVSDHKISNLYPTPKINIKRCLCKNWCITDRLKRNCSETSRKNIFYLYVTITIIIDGKRHVFNGMEKIFAFVCRIAYHSRVMDSRWRFTHHNGEGALESRPRSADRVTIIEQFNDRLWARCAMLSLMSVRRSLRK